MLKKIILKLLKMFVGNIVPTVSTNKYLTFYHSHVCFLSFPLKELFAILENTIIRVNTKN